MVLEQSGQDKMVRECSNEEVLERVGEKRVQLNDIRHRDANSIELLRISCFLHDTIEGQTTQVKRVGGRKTQLLDNLRNR